MYIRLYASAHYVWIRAYKPQGENEVLFSQVQEFIANSGRFTWGNRD